jgi:hypothetical protein
MNYYAGEGRRLEGEVQQLRKENMTLSELLSRAKVGLLRECQLMQKSRLLQYKLYM